LVIVNEDGHFIWLGSQVNSLSSSSLVSQQYRLPWRNVRTLCLTTLLCQLLLGSGAFGEHLFSFHKNVSAVVTQFRLALKNLVGCLGFRYLCLEH